MEVGACPTDPGASLKSTAFPKRMVYHILQVFKMCVKYPKAKASPLITVGAICRWD